MAEHIAGYPVSRASYQKRHCRCPGCVEANAVYIRALRDRDRARYNALQRNYNTVQRIGKRRRDRIEQAIARGHPASRIMADFGLTYAQLRLIIDSMDDAA